MKNYVAYYRVSTQKQGCSGLGLNAQKNTVNNFVNDNGSIIAEYTEIETGKNNNRIELNKAIETAKNNNATLIIAKLDRLSRNASFIFQLQDSQIDFIACDIPQANRMTIGIFALLAEQERQFISERTSAALQAKKAQGAVLGTPQNFTDKTRAKGRLAYHNIAIENENNKRAFAMVKALRNSGLSYRQIANELNTNGFKTSTGKSFYANSIKQLETLFSAQS